MTTHHISGGAESDAAPALSARRARVLIALLLVLLLAATLGYGFYRLKIPERGEPLKVALAQGRPVRPGERIAYYITGSDPNVRGFEHCRSVDDWNPNFPDENTAFYLRRLSEFASKFEDFFLPQHFHEIFSPEGLFPFDPSGIRPLVTPVAPEQEEPTEQPTDEA